MEKQFKERDDYYFAVIYENLFPNKVGSKKLLLENGMTFNEKDSADSYTFFDYYNDYYLGTSLDNDKTPHLLYTGMGSILQLETLNYDEDILEYLNIHGLNIYLYETTVVDLKPKKKFYVTRNQEYGADYINFRFETNSDFYVFEFESIEEFVRRNNLTNVTVFTCEGNTSKVSKQYSFKIKSKEIFLVSLLKEASEEITGYEISKDLVSRFDPVTITHKFWSGNWRYDVHRHVICSHLVNKSSKLSWYYNSSLSEVRQFFWFDITKWNNSTILEGDQTLCKNAPYVLDITAPATKVNLQQLWTIPTEEFFCPSSSTTPLESYLTTFCAVVTESNFAHPFPMFSEKTVNAIKAGRPFIVASSAGTLEYLRQHGFKTFSEFWDESYDLEENHERRLQMILKVIDYIDSMSVEQLQELYSKIKPTIEYNFRRLIEIKNEDLSF